MRAVGPAFKAAALIGPEVFGQRKRAAVEQVAILQGFVVFIVFGGQTDGARLDAHVDVFGDKNDRAARVLLREGGDNFQNLVVGLALRQQLGRGGVQRCGLKPELAARLKVPACGQGQAGGHVGMGHEQVKLAADLARVAGDFAGAFFVRIQLFEHDHGQEDVVLFKAEQGRGVVQEHIGIQHEELDGFRRGGAAGFCGFCGLRGLFDGGLGGRRLACRRLDGGLRCGHGGVQRKGWRLRGLCGGFSALGGRGPGAAGFAGGGVMGITIGISLRRQNGGALGWGGWQGRHVCFSGSWPARSKKPQRVKA